MAAKKQLAVLTTRRPVRFDGKNWHFEVDHSTVEVMAVVTRYAMVRKKGCMPFVALAENLAAPNTQEKD